MSANAYELLALAMRYVFAGLMILIVLRAWRITAVDSRRAAKLRRLSPDTGIIGEMLIMNGSERAKPGMRYPVTLEGAIGSGRNADIRIRHSSVRSRHALYQMTDDGLFVRGHARTRIRDGRGRYARQLVLRDGDIVRFGDVSLMLVLTDADNAPEETIRRVRRRHRDENHREPEERFEGGFTGDFDNGIFETRPDADDLFMSNPAGRLDGYDEPEPRNEYDAPHARKKSHASDRAGRGHDPAAFDEFDNFDNFDNFDEFDEF